MGKKKNKEMSQEEILEKEVLNNKEVEFYSHLVNAWLTTRMEKDKAILTLSTAGLGVLVTFFNNISYTNIISLLLYGASLIFFIIAIISGVWILSENADYCEAVIKEEEAKNEKLIIILDKILMGGFIIGLSLSITLSFVLIYNKDLQEKQKVSFSKNIIEIENEVEKTLNLKNQLEKNIKILSNNLEEIKLLKEKQKETESEIKLIIEER